MASYSHPLNGRKLHIPRMSIEGAEVLAAVFRSVGVQALVSPESDENTLKLAARFTTGEECLPERITLGNFLKIILDRHFEPARHAFFLPTSSGPCRFGQYSPFLEKILRELDYADAMVIAPTSSDGYASVAQNKYRFLWPAWRAVIVSDALRKLLLMFRPYESRRGEADRLMQESLSEVVGILERNDLSLGRQRALLTGAMEASRDRFMHLTLAEEKGTRPLVGVVGEIFLRFNEFSNQYLLRRIEAAGGETWIAGVAEWIYYTNTEERRKLRDRNRQWHPSMHFARLRYSLQHREEMHIIAPLAPLFGERPDARVEEILRYSRPYLPADKALGEMTLNSGNTIAFRHAGCDGVVDISPFTCMNGIVTEAVYPVISRDFGDFPVRVFYFDGVPLDLDNDLEIFMEMVHSYRKRKNI